MDMVINFLIFNIVIFEYQMFTHLKPSKPMSNLYQKLLMSSIIVDATWTSLKNPHKIHMNEGQNNDFEDMFIKKNVFEKQKKNPFETGF